MPRLVLILLAALALIPTAAFAARSGSGDGVFELKGAALVYKSAVIGRGAIWGQIDQGRLVVTDPNPEDANTALVSGNALHTHISFDGGTTIYTGKNIRFRFAGGRYRFVLSGFGVDLTAVGVGKATLTGSLTVDDDGYWAVDGGKWQAVPLLTTVIPFGVQPTPPLPPTGQ